jgi:muramoyltetrapeptide carboxypeptidase
MIKKKSVRKIYPQRLKKGGKIGVIATSSSISTLGEEQIKRGYRYLQDQGFEIVEHPQCRLENGYTAGSIKKRVEAIHQFVKDDEIDCVMAFWGGLNTNQLLDYLDYQLIKENPKIFVGFSDTCALLQAITNKAGLVTYVGPAVITFSKPNPEKFKYTWEYFHKMCIEENRIVKIKSADFFADDLYFLRKDNDHRIIKKNKGVKIFREGKCEGEVIASNLSTLLALAGTDYFPDLEDKVLFIEEAEDFNCQWIDRFFFQLKQAKVIESIRGLVVGKFMEASKISEKQLLDILNNVIGDFQIPVIYSANFGHTDPIFTVPNGGRCRVDTSSKQIDFIQG